MCPLGYKKETNGLSVSLQHCLTYWGRLTHICASKLDHHWFRCVSIVSWVPSHYINQCWLGNKRPMNKIQLILNQNTSIQENAFKNVVCKMAAILFLSRCVNSYIADYQNFVSSALCARHLYDDALSWLYREYMIYVSIDIETMQWGLRDTFSCIFLF